MGGAILSDLVTQELERRLGIWRVLGPTDSVEPQRLRQLGIYGGAQGIWVDKKRTAEITSNGSGVTVGLLHTGSSYPDDLSSDGVLYHYPKTQRPAGRDAAEVKSTKAAGTLRLPVFVVTPSPANPSRKEVHLGWVEDSDDLAGLFLVSFSETPPPAIALRPEDDPTFELMASVPRKRAGVDIRPGQQRFKFSVLKRYGPACAVCGIGVTAVLDAAHLCPKEKHGCDDARNGLVLCAVHHRAFDAGLFSIHPDTTEIVFKSSGPTRSELHITSSCLSHLVKKPHREALAWCWNEWNREQSE